MIKFTDKLVIGESADVEHGDLGKHGITAVLNVASDLPKHKKCGDGMEYAQVGLVDGPGNEVGDYCAAVLALSSLVRRHSRVLVYDHDGARSLVVGMMYLRLVEGKVKVRSDYLRRRTWEEMGGWVLGYFEDKGVSIHQAHVEAFDKLPYGLLEVM